MSEHPHIPGPKDFQALHDRRLRDYKEARDPSEHQLGRVGWFTAGLLRDLKGGATAKQNIQTCATHAAGFALAEAASPLIENVLSVNLGEAVNQPSSLTESAQQSLSQADAHSLLFAGFALINQPGTRKLLNKMFPLLLPQLAHLKIAEFNHWLDEKPGKRFAFEFSRAGITFEMVNLIQRLYGIYEHGGGEAVMESFNNNDWATGLGLMAIGVIMSDLSLRMANIGIKLAKNRMMTS